MSFPLSILARPEVPKTSLSKCDKRFKRGVIRSLQLGKDSTELSLLIVYLALFQPILWPSFLLSL